MKRNVLSLISFLICFTALGQEPIVLKNPSFEGMPRPGKTPKDWYDCGFPGESAVDVQPSKDYNFPFFNVTQQAADGKTYMGMVTRDNDTWELVAQRLSTPITAGQPYKFSIDLCRSETYESPSRVTGKVVNYTSPIKLRIWGGDGYCAKKQLLAKTPLVINTQWLTFEVAFTPEEDFSYIVLECFYKTPVRFPYNGNLLVDNASPIFPIEKAEADSISARTNKLTVNINTDYSKYTPDSKDYYKPTVPKSNRRKNSNAKPFDYEKARNSNFSNNPNRPVIKEKKPKKRAPSSHDWKSNSEMPDSVKTFLSNMQVDFDKEEFGGSTKISLIYILGNISRIDDFNTMTIGIAAKGKERDRLQQPFLKFMEEFGIPEERIKFKKVKSAEDGTWIGKNEWYQINVE